MPNHPRKRKGRLIKMENLEIRAVNSENVDALINLCIPADKKDDPFFVEGMKAKKRWATRVLEDYGSFAKLAYLGSSLVGLIQYRLNREERLVEIGCIFVPEEQHNRKGIAKSLLEALIKDMKNPQPAFGNDIPLALVTYAFEVPGRYPQHEFYQRMGFKRVTEDEPFLLYYPLKKGYVHVRKEEKFTPQEEDKGKVLIFFSPSCPWSIYFSEKTKESVRAAAPDILIRTIDMFWEIQEVKNRGRPCSCVVNGKPIEVLFMDKENFQKEVKKALKA
jgi:GNAT superfamily N-acetyltransferase